MRPGVMIGVHAHAEPVHLVETVRSLPAAGAGDAQVVLLPDGPDAALSAALTAEPALATLPQWGTAEPLGPPACFNRLASRTDAAVVVLVESGTVLGPGCLRLLVEALARPGRGLAGPSRTSRNGKRPTRRRTTDRAAAARGTETAGGGCPCGWISVTARSTRHAGRRGGADVRPPPR